MQGKSRDRASARGRQKGVSTSSASEFDKAKNAAYRLLAQRARSASEISEKLRKKGFDRETVEGVSARLAELRLLDDADYARRYARELVEIRGYGRYAVEQRLKEKGIGGEDIAAAIEAALPGEREFDAARRAAEKKLGGASLTHKERGRIGRFLQGRGYPFEIIMEVLKGLNERDGD